LRTPTEGRRQADGGARAAPSACSTPRWRCSACDRVPIVVLAGNTLDATMTAGVEWDHSAGRRGDGARFHQVGRPAGRRTSRNPRCASRLR
jgi:hypothetical protein